MAANYYELYKPVPERYPKQIATNILYRPYRHLQSFKIRVHVSNYRIVLKESLNGTETVKEVRDRLENDASGVSDSADRSAMLRIGDVIAVTKKGLTLAYYVDPNRLILLPDFFSQPSSAALIALDSTGYMIEGRKGSWMAADSAMIDGKIYYLMLSETYGRKAPYVIIDERGTVIATDSQGFTEDSISRIREAVRQLELRREADAIASGRNGPPHLENWQKRYENGEYIRSAEMSSEQNYNMIDGMINNVAADESGPRRSVLERLSEKKDAVDNTPKLNPPAPQNKSITIHDDTQRIIKR